MYIYIYVCVKQANMRICKLQRHRFRASSGGTMAESIRKHAWCEPQCAMYDQKQHQQKEEETSQGSCVARTSELDRLWGIEEILAPLPVPP